MIVSTPGDRQQANKLRTVRTPQDFSVRRNRNPKTPVASTKTPIVPTKTPIASTSKRKPVMKTSMSSKKEPMSSTFNDNGKVMILV